MSGVIKFLKSLVASEPAASKVVSKTSDLSSQKVSIEPSLGSSSLAESSIKAVKPHVPLIKFRKGGPASGHAVGSGAPSLSIGGGRAAVSQGTIEDYQLPRRFQRTPLDEREIDYINRGGPE